MSEITGFTADATTALPLHVLDRDQYAGWKARQPAALQAWLDAQGFTAGGHSVALLPGGNGLAGAVIGVGDRADAYAYAHAPHALPEGSVWQLASELPAEEQALLHHAEDDGAKGGPDDRAITAGQQGAADDHADDRL